MSLMKAAMMQLHTFCIMHQLPRAVVNAHETLQQLFLSWCLPHIPVHAFAMLCFDLSRRHRGFKDS